MMNDDRATALDRMRYTKNTSSSRLALLAILFDVLFFVSIYKSDVGSYYYTILIGASIIYNLVFLLAAFLASEGVKNYKTSFSWLLIVLGAVQLIRIFIIPMNARTSAVNGIQVMSDFQFWRTVLYLSLSAICLFLSAAVNLRKSRALAAHLKTLEEAQI